MYKKELDELIRSKSLPSSILLYGEQYLSPLYAQFIAKKKGDKDNMLKLYFEEYDFTLAKSYLSQASLFGDINLLYLKSDKKIPKKELDDLVDCCFKNQTSFFVFEFCGDDRVGRDLAKSFVKKKSADNVRFFKPSFNEAMEILKKKAQKFELDIDSYALTHLYRLQNEELIFCVNELEKLKLVGKKIGVNEIDSHIFGLGEIELDDFIESFLKKEDIKDSLYSIIEEEGVDELRILSAFESYFTTLLLFRLYITAHGTMNVMDILGYNLPSHLANKRATFSNKISLEIFKQILDHLLDAQLTLKTSTNIDKKSFLIASLIKLQTYL